MVLAKDALQVAVRKKNIADAMVTAYRRFFTPVAANRADMKTGIGSAITRNMGIPVRVALSRAQAAIR
jgi:hypothetical protein